MGTPLLPTYHGQLKPPVLLLFLYSSLKIEERNLGFFYQGLWISPLRITTVLQQFVSTSDRHPFLHVSTLGVVNLVKM